MVIKVPLITLITASNELPEDENELTALCDRLLIRCVVDYIKDDRNFREKLLGDEKIRAEDKDFNRRA